MFHIETMFHAETCIRFTMKNASIDVDKLTIHARLNLDFIKKESICGFVNIGTEIAIILVQSFTIKGGKT